MCLYIARCSLVQVPTNVLWLQNSPWKECRGTRHVPQRCSATLTLKERWNPVTSVILFCTILLRFGGDFEDLWRRRQWWFWDDLKLHFSETKGCSREWSKRSHCAGWSTCCGALNGSPVDNATRCSVRFQWHNKSQQLPILSKKYIYFHGDSLVYAQDE